MAQLFAERFLVAPAAGCVPVPDRYDEMRGLSLTADGRPFIEADAGHLDTHTVTFTDAEGSDDDRDRLAAAAGHTETRAAGERPDSPLWARPLRGRTRKPRPSGSRMTMRLSRG